LQLTCLAIAGPLSNNFITKPNFMSGTEKEGTRVDFLLRFFQNNKISAVVIVLCLALIGLSKVVDSSNQLLRWCGIVETYDVNQVTARGRFSWELTETAWNRLFWMRNYTERIRRNAPTEDQAVSWQKLMQATEKWSTELMNYYIGLDTYYPESRKREILENQIQPSINAVMTNIVNLRYALPKLDSMAVETKVKEIKDSIEIVNIKLYDFVDQPLHKR
jgi:hypothetical protein